MKKNHINIDLRLTGGRLFAEVLYGIAIKYKFKIIIVGRITSYTSSFFAVLKECLQDHAEFIETEEEETAINSAIDASYHGALAVLLLSSHGIQKIIEGLMKAILSELPLLIINIQHYFALTDISQQVIQTDLEQICYGGYDGLSVPIMAFNKGENQIKMIIASIEIAFQFMTPVVILVNMPSLLETYSVAPRQLESIVLKNRIFYSFYRKWYLPASKQSQYLYHINKNQLSQELKYYRTKFNEIAKINQLYSLEGDRSATYGLISWGSTDIIAETIFKRLLSYDLSFCHIHLKLVHPIPKKVISIVQSMKQLFIIELNTGQLARLIRIKTFIPIELIAQMNGDMFNEDDVIDFIRNKILPAES